jgi:MoxR-like ATPase
VTRQLLHHPIEDLEPVLTPEEVAHHQQAVRSVHVADAIVDYAVALVGATRWHAHAVLGASPRAAVALTRCGQARAAVHGRGYVLPDDVKTLAPAVLGHRILTAVDGTGARTGRDLVAEILEQVPVPLGVTESV